MPKSDSRYSSEVLPAKRISEKHSTTLSLFRLHGVEEAAAARYLPLIFQFGSQLSGAQLYAIAVQHNHIGIKKGSTMNTRDPYGGIRGQIGFWNRWCKMTESYKEFPCRNVNCIKHRSGEHHVVCSEARKRLNSYTIRDDVYRHIFSKEPPTYSPDTIEHQDNETTTSQEFEWTIPDAKPPVHTPLPLPKPDNDAVFEQILRMPAQETLQHLALAPYDSDVNSNYYNFAPTTSTSLPHPLIQHNQQSSFYAPPPFDYKDLLSSLDPSLASLLQ